MIHSKAKNVNMLSGPILPEMLRFALPMLVTYLIDIAFNAADRMVAGQCAGSGALAAVSASGPVLTLLVGIFNGLAVGSTVVIARHIGAKRPDLAERAVHTAACLSLIISVVVITVGMLLCDTLLTLLKTPADIYADSAVYFRIRLIGLAFDTVYKFGAGALRAVGETKKPLTFSVIAGFLNVALNYLLVAGLHMGVAGLAIATDASSLTTVVCVLLYQLRTTGLCRLEPRKLKLHWKSVREIIRIGVPSSITSACFNTANAVIQSALNSLGTAAVAANAASSTYTSISSCVIQAGEHAATTFTSQNYGAKQLERMWGIFRSAMLLSGFLLVPLAVCYALFGPAMLSLFVQKTDANFDQIIHYGMLRLYFIGCFELIHAAMNVTAGMLRGLQKPWLPTFSVVFGSIILRILWISFVFPLHPTGEMIYVCYPVTWCLTVAFELTAMAVILKRYQKTSPFLPTT